MLTDAVCMSILSTEHMYEHMSSIDVGWNRQLQEHCKNGPETSERLSRHENKKGGNDVKTLLHCRQRRTSSSKYNDEINVKTVLACVEICVQHTLRVSAIKSQKRPLDERCNSRRWAVCGWCFQYVPTSIYVIETEEQHLSKESGGVCLCIQSSVLCACAQFNSGAGSAASPYKVHRARWVVDRTRM